MLGTDSTESIVCSVIVPTYNRAQWLPGCIDSLRRSGTRGLEIILVDDGSTDDTPRVVRELGGDIRYVRQPNGGVAAAWNAGLREASGRYVAFLDSDDRWLPGGHQRLVEFLDGHPEVSVGFADAWAGNPQVGYRPWTELVDRESLWGVPGIEPEEGFKVFERRAFFRRESARRQPITIGAVVVRRSVLDKVGGFDVTMRHASDWELWMRLATQYTFAYFDRPLFVYERHGGGLADDHGAMGDGFVQALDRILTMDLQLPPEELAWLKARLTQQLYGGTYAAFWRGEHAIARQRAATWMKLRGVSSRALLYWCCSWLRPGAAQRLRAVKHRAAELHIAARRARSAPPLRRQ